jgi:tRNA A37 N6-isopentenylltransferase MiaA
MKVIFLDIDGVLNCSKTLERFHGCFGLDKELVVRMNYVKCCVSDLKIVLSSTWRILPENKEEVERHLEIYDTTCKRWFDREHEHHSTRGEEIQEWLNRHPEVEKYVILDDDTDMLPEQLPHFFRTYWDNGLTEEIADSIINRFNYDV